MTDTATQPANRQDSARKGGLIGSIITLHDGVFNAIRKAAGDWFVPGAARLTFAAVLLMYFLNSAFTKFGGAPLGLGPSDGAYFQILPSVMEAYEFDPSAVPLTYMPVLLGGMYGELILPILIVIGLFTRVAALGMIVFIAVQTYVDINFHGLDEKSIGAPFDNLSGALIWDQRLLWVFLLLVLVVQGAGKLSLDTILSSSRHK